ncbi:HEAT repeat domain-containing protein [Phormidium sp. CCY1219]|uniref:HEAT repeat domain-containing protein n=1 Tax=Phormidium sp. CCY1219 TaxID=2886104 RepID=UPI002D1EB691|nr:HEAT repeat domain-containing protein [Phormidium sp. CCY1219]MEB3831107.1 HEAT repeat domain-containing protein [Phormidium sp. CCY1219]
MADSRVSSNVPPAPSQAQTDRLLETINEQLAEGNFDRTDAKLLQQMVSALADSRGMTRLGLVEAFGIIGEAAAPFLMDGLANHPNPVVRRSCGKALAKISYPGAIPILMDALLSDEDTVVRSSAAGALAKMGAPAVQALLDTLTADVSETAKGHAAWALAFMGESAREPLMAAIASDSVDVRCAVVSALGNIAQGQQGDRALAKVLLALRDREAAVRVEAAAVLGQVGSPLGVSALIERLNDPSESVRRAAVLALGKIGDRSALEALQGKLTDERESVRQVAAIAIAQIEPHSS